MTEQDALDLLSAHFMVQLNRWGGSRSIRDSAFAMLGILASLMTRKEFSNGMIVSAPYNSGKTTLLKALQGAINHLNYYEEFKLVDEDAPMRSTMGLSIYDVRELLYLSEYYKDFNRLCTCPMLAIDNVGKEVVNIPNYENDLNPIIDIIEQRRSRGLFTILATNFDEEQLGLKYGMLYVKRLKDYFRWCEISSEPEQIESKPETAPKRSTIVF